MPFEWAGEFSLTSGAHQMSFEAGPNPEIKLLFAPLVSSLNEMEDTVKAQFEDNEIASVTRRNVPLGEVVTLAFDENGGTFVFDAPQDGRYALWTQHHPDEFAAKFSRDGEEISTSSTREYKGSHTHDDAVTSVGIDIEGECDPDRLNVWISKLLEEQGPDVFRTKGVLAIRGERKRFVFQGVHMLFGGELERDWKRDEKRRNQMIFIGRNLNRAALNSGFRSCLA